MKIENRSAIDILLEIRWLETIRWLTLKKCAKKILGCDYLILGCDLKSNTYPFLIPKI